MAIFNDYRSHGFNAYLNWIFDNDMGSDEKYHMAWCDKELGKAYLQNAAMSLSSLLDGQPNDPEFDVLIFPVLFGLWQSVELQLKAGNRLCDLLLKDPTNYKYVTHDLSILRDDFERKLARLGFRNVKNNHLSGMDEFIDECKTKNAHFDFARYTRMSDGSEQFYLKKNPTTGFVENTCVDMYELGRIMANIIEHLPEVTSYLYDYIGTYGVDDLTHLNDASLDDYAKPCEFEASVDVGEHSSVADVYAKYEALIRSNLEKKKAAETESAAKQKE